MLQDEVGMDRGQLSSMGGEVEFSFRAPETGVLRLVAFGDSGSGTADQYAVAQALEREPLLPNLVMMVGDVIYSPFDARLRHGSSPPAAAALILLRAARNPTTSSTAGSRSSVFNLPWRVWASPRSSYWLERKGVQMIVRRSKPRCCTAPPAQPARQPAVPPRLQHQAMLLGPQRREFPRRSSSTARPIYTATASTSCSTYELCGIRAGSAVSST
jgi:hypothetical protein